MGQQVRKWVVELSVEQRAELQKTARSQKCSSLMVKRARVLLLSDVSHPEGRRTDEQIAALVGMTRRQVQRIRSKFSHEGLEATTRRKVRSDQGTPKVFDGRAEAQLVTLSCSTPPEGHQRWTLRLLVDELSRLQIVTSVCPETVRKTLKKTRLKPWQSRRFCIPERDRARFVAHMEKVLDIYQETYDETHVLICMDEASKQVVADVEPALPMCVGQPRREDHHYERKDVRALFLFFDPIGGWRRVSNRRSRTREDWAEEVRTLIEVDYAHAEQITLVMDNLNTHDIASFYATFDAALAHRLARKLRIVQTPRNGSWLNMAEIELSILSRQCLNRRFNSVEQMQREIEAWQTERNDHQLGANWRFTTSNARTKLKSLYPIQGD
ncbi:MAG: IS630 family transposase [Planctomycetaceae bacterium]|nr:IS630 family transposase [Planctomycetaceae bacterium]